MLTILLALYIFCAILLTLYAASQILLLIIYWRHRKTYYVPSPPIETWPTVLIQLPIYNERYVVERLLDAMAALDYPRDRLIVQLLDDSNDETVTIAAAHVVRLQQAGLNIHHVRRPERKGYKAGALSYGLDLVGDQAELVAVLDADFVPPPDFLRRTVPFLVTDPGLGMVQTRWGHLNPDTNWLTLGQTLALDGHFVIEQTARSRGGWLMTFNGSGGVWKIKAIREAGGWRDLTLTEDLDLSYRAQLAGWRFFYLPDMVVPGELPPQMAAFKQQQARWAKGTTQCLGHLLGPLWRSNVPLFQRLMSTLHLCQYMPAPIMIILLLLTLPLLLSGALHGLHLGVLGFIGLGTPLIYITSQRKLYPDWKRRLLAYPMLMAMGIGIAWSNSKAVIGGLFNWDTEFRRTPKFARDWQGHRYALRRDSINTWMEFFFSLYSAVAAVVALQTAPAYTPYLVIYSFAFALIGFLGLRDGWIFSRAAANKQPQQATSSAAGG